MAFPKDFVWGAAAASYQIEGAAGEDGRGLSVWDTFSKRPGAVWLAHNGDVACDHYHRFREDVAIMKEIGLQSYRFSISWPRVIPNGVGCVNQKGLDFYDSLVDELLAAGITPYATLFHWDYPYELYCRGGWLNPESSDWFADYTRVVVDRLSDRVCNWMTLNEPQCFIIHGHSNGTNAPGLKLDLPDVLRAIHNVHLSHGKSVQAIRANAKTPSRVGMASVAVVKSPATEDPKDVDAARRMMYCVRDENDLWSNTWWLDPLYLGRYPEDGMKVFARGLPTIKDGDMETINQPLDYFGLNIYAGERVRAGEDGKPEVVAADMSGMVTNWGVKFSPECMYWAAEFHYERYKLPMLITENGISCSDSISLDGKVHDPLRIDYLHRHLMEFERAGDDGVPIMGYLHWSILDNFEWAEGYKHRFGLVFVDYPTLRRIPKDSAAWYGEVIKTNGASLHHRA